MSSTTHTFDSDVIDAPDLHIATGSGRVTFDARGHGIWEWQTQPGVFSRDISSEQLRQLDNGLRLVDATPRRNFEGLWIHDTDRVLAAEIPLRFEAPAKIVSKTSEHAKRGAFESFMRRLRLPL